MFDKRTESRTSRPEAAGSAGAGEARVRSQVEAAPVPSHGDMALGHLCCSSLLGSTHLPLERGAGRGGEHCHRGTHRSATSSQGSGSSRQGPEVIGS